VINKFYLLCVIFSGSPDLTLKTCLVFALASVWLIPSNNMLTSNKVVVKLQADRSSTSEH